MPTITGTSNADDLLGSDDADTITGSGGNDFINGRDGNDLIDGGSNNDTVFGGDGDDTVIVYAYDFRSPQAGGGNALGTGVSILDGGAGFDTLLVRDGTARPGGITDELVGYRFYENTEGGPDDIRVTLNIDGRMTGSYPLVATATRFEAIVGSEQNDEIILPGRLAATLVRAGGGNDFILTGLDAADLIYAGSGDDLVSAGRGDSVFGDDGDDTFSMSSQFGEPDSSVPTLVDGGAGRDQISYLTSVAGNFSLGDGTREGVTFRSIEDISVRFSGPPTPDPVRVNINGSDADNVIRMQVVSSPRLPSGQAEGEVHAGAGNDTVEVTGNYTVYGGDGNDLIRGGTRLYGGSGNDDITGRGSLFGDDGDDTLTGEGTSVIRGGQGNDLIRGWGSLFGDAGDDTFSIDTERDASIDGGEGSDTVLVSMNSVTISLQDGSDWSPIYPSATITLRSIENLIGNSQTNDFTGNLQANRLIGGDGDDFLRGGGGDDVLIGDQVGSSAAPGVDRLFGEDGNDFLLGGGGEDFLDGGSGDDTINGGTGNDLIAGGIGFDTAVFGYRFSSATITYEGSSIVLVGPEGRDILTGIEQLEFSDSVIAIGLDGQIVQRGPSINGTSGNDNLTGTSAGEAIDGQAGDDVLRGGAGNDSISGGEGTDAAVYAGLFRGYSSVTGTRVSGGQEGGIDILTGVESLRFLDGRMSYDVNDVSTVIYRLYDAAFDRGPDAFGLAQFSADIASGQYTVYQILDAFAASAEFQARYGALNNDQFVREMYRFSLNREGDAAGIALYVDALNTGTTRATILGLFSESIEHKQIIDQQIAQNGLWVQDERTLAVARLYDTVFDRVPDLPGLASFRLALDQGYTLADVATVLIGSQEFIARYGSLNNQQFVEQIYRAVLNREGDAAGIASFVAALSNGYTRTDVALAFSESLEHRILYQATWENAVRNLDTDGAPTNGLDEPQSKVLDDGRLVNVGPDAREADDILFDLVATADDDAFVLPSLGDGENPLVLPGLLGDSLFDDMPFDIAAPPLVVQPLDGDRMLTVNALDGLDPSDPPWDPRHGDHWLQ